MGFRKRGPVLAGLLTAVLLAGVVPAAAGDDAGFTLRLPAPTGPYPVGTTALHLVDGSRTDPWNGAATRELMVTVRYPAGRTAGHRVAPQFTPGAAAAFERIDTGLHAQLPQGKVDWAATETHSYTDAPAAPGRRPVLLYSPGLGDPRTIGTQLAEDLASRGHVVVTVDHPGEASEVEFPGGRVRTIELPTDPAQAPQTIRTAGATRLADTAFVLDELAVLASGRNPDAEQRALPPGLAEALDLDRVGAYGHSAGGSIAAESLYRDRRIDAAADLDGNLNYPPARPGEPAELFGVAEHGTDRPLLLFGSEFGRDEDIERSWSAAVHNRRGWLHRVQLDKAAHHVFTDFSSMAPQLAAAGLMSAADRDALIGPIDPAVSVPAVRDRMASFFGVVFFGVVQDGVVQDGR
ncbi:hypothetical protein [Amycolatopsis nigrescens]|uniref:alpha/beta hydrolase n=1 Tax=Amycolatopsis nigrescens TaxID=381445 RepID=UPI000366B5F0|nr:hypothetical protein [Amycolatopsis nigrescens]